MSTIRLTAAQAMVRYLSAQMTEDGERFIDGIWAIFGHGNVAGLGEALEQAGNALPTWRGQNEQTMAHTAIAYAKATKRTRAMAVTSSIGPGATNMVTAAALAHVNRLPVLLIPGDVFANRAPDPVLQQVEDFDDGTVSANDCFRPVSRYFDRISRPEHLLTALPRAFRVMTDPANCGPVTLAFCQDTQAEAFDYPASFFEPKIWRIRRPEPDSRDVADITALIKAAKNPVLVCGGGVIYSQAEETLGEFATKHGIPVIETQAGKSALAQSHPMNFGTAGVDGSACANEIAETADLVIGVGTRFQDFTTGSWALFKQPGRKLVSINVQSYDALKHGAMGLVGDAKVALEKISAALGDDKKSAFDPQSRLDWLSRVDAHCSARTNVPDDYLPLDAEVIGAVQRTSSEKTIAMCAAGTMPGALKLLWQAPQGGYHMEYGFSCMGYEVAAGIGVDMAAPDRPNVVFAGDGSYLMLNAELATAVMMGTRMTLIITDNRGFGCINRLQAGTGGAAFNNLFADSHHEVLPEIDFVAHAASMGARAQKAGSIAELEAMTAEAITRDGVDVIVIDTDPGPSTAAGGAWWEVGVPEVSDRAEVAAAYEGWRDGKQRQLTRGN